MATPMLAQTQHTGTRATLPPTPLLSRTSQRFHGTTRAQAPWPPARWAIQSMVRAAFATYLGVYWIRQRLAAAGQAVAQRGHLQSAASLAPHARDTRSRPGRKYSGTRVGLIAARPRTTACGTFLTFRCSRRIRTGFGCTSTSFASPARQSAHLAPGHRVDG